MASLFDPVRLGDLALRNRIVMAPLTRNRAASGQVPSALAVEYYRQRADAGLIVTEATHISPLGQGYLDTPGIYSRAQVDGWKPV
ncbi:oxidoreductase, partial [Salmonella enterica]|uniref:oxidoreductase n=1 Tax=Salmonella enterica TaxID=28901 RepID=UPI003FA77A6D